MREQNAPARELIPVNLSSGIVTFSPPVRGVIVGEAGVLKIKTVGASAFVVTKIIPEGLLACDIAAIDPSGTTAAELTAIR